MGIYSDELGEFQEMWDGAQKRKEELGNKKAEKIPDGEYQCEVEEVAMQRSKSSGKLMLKWQMGILLGEHAGRKIWKYSMLPQAGELADTNQKRVENLTVEFARCGVVLPRIADIEDKIDDLLKRKVAVRVKSGSGDMPYINIMRGVEEPVGAAAKQSFGAAPKKRVTDDFPF